MKTIMALLGLLAMVSCTWVEPSEQNKSVTLVKAARHPCQPWEP